MKKLRIIAICLLAVVLCASAGMVVGASKEPVRVLDDAELLTDGQREALVEDLKDLERAYDNAYTFIVVTTDSLDGKNVDDYAFDYCENLTGEDNIILLVICMESRDVYIAKKGRAQKALKEEGLYATIDAILPLLSEGEYDEAMQVYVTELEANFREVKAITLNGALIVMGLSSVIALIAVFSMKSKLKSVRPQLMAKQYADNFALTVERDTFSHSRVTKTAKPQNNSSRSGGGSSSRGRNYSGGGRKF